VYDDNMADAKAKRHEMIERITADPKWIAKQMRKRL